MTRGKFITFEGAEGAGKSSVIAAIAPILSAQGKAVCCTREPGNGEVGAQIRNLLLHTKGSLDTRAEIFLFMADRAQHMSHFIQPCLERGEWVLCDRHADSTVVYQGYARGFDIEQLRAWNAAATYGVKPDLTVLLDIDPEIGLKRQLDADRLGGMPIEFHRKVRNGFLQEAAREPDRYVVIDASQPLEQVQSAVLDAIDARLGD